MDVEFFVDVCTLYAVLYTVQQTGQSMIFLYIRYPTADCLSLVSDFRMSEIRYSDSPMLKEVWPDTP